MRAAHRAVARLCAERRASRCRSTSPYGPVLSRRAFIALSTELFGEEAIVIVGIRKEACRRRGILSSGERAAMTSPLLALHGHGVMAQHRRWRVALYRLPSSIVIVKASVAAHLQCHFIIMRFWRRRRAKYRALRRNMARNYAASAVKCCRE